MTAAGNDVPLSQDLVDLIRTTANAEGRTPEEILWDAINSYISDRRWQRVLAYGKRQAEALGYADDDVERLIHESRAV